VGYVDEKAAKIILKLALAKAITSMDTRVAWDANPVPYKAVFLELDTTEVLTSLLDEGFVTKYPEGFSPAELSCCIPRWVSTVLLKEDRVEGGESPRDVQQWLTPLRMRSLTKKTSKKTLINRELVKGIAEVRDKMMLLLNLGYSEEELSYRKGVAGCVTDLFSNNGIGIKFPLRDPRKELEDVDELDDDDFGDELEFDEEYFGVI